MADRDQSTSSATGIFAVLALVAGAVILQQPPLIGSRPSATLPARDLGARENVNARLWQDPIGAVRKHLDESTASGPKTKRDQGQDAHDPGKLLKGFAKSSKVYLIVAMMTGGAYANLEEFRRRQRYAIVSALATAGFAPEYPERIGYVQFREKLATGGLPLFVPFEWFFKERADGKSKHWTAVLYFDEDVLYTKKPLEQLRGLIEKVDPGLKRGRWSVIGPGSTDILRAMVGELSAKKEPSRSRKKYPREPGTSSGSTTNEEPSGGVRFFVSQATASDRQLTGTDDRVDQVFAKHGHELHRITSTDDALAKSLARELELRGAWEKGETTRRRVYDETEKGAKNREAIAAALDELPRVVLISEWDTLYGRRFAVDMREALLDSLEEEKRAADREAICPAPGKPRTEYSKRCPLLHFSYFRGLDGQLPASAKSDKSSAKQQEEDRESGKDRKDDKSKRTAVERPVGDSQVDYLRRLGQHLADVHSELRAHGRQGISAVGVLGTDLYDKLLVLQAVRNTLPEAVLFTTDLDAEMIHPAEVKLASHNLVVASAFGLRLNDELQANHPPFRDTYETATYLATRSALDDKVLERIRSSSLSPRLFEIGRNSIVDLSEEKGGSGGGGSGSAIDAQANAGEWLAVHPPRSYPRISSTVTIPIAIFLVLTAALLTLTFRQVQHGVSEGWKVATQSRWNFSLTVGVAAGLAALVYFAWQDVRAPLGEPWAVANGVSMWPTQILRLVTWALTCLLLRKGWNDIKKSNERLTREFSLEHSGATDADASKRSWRQTLGERFRPWAKEESYKGDQSAIEIWRRHIEPSGFGDRIRLMIVPVVLYIGAIWVLFFLFGFPVRPMRGGTVFWVDLVILMLCIVSFAFLLFFVIDETRRCGSLVRRLSGNSNWPADTLSAPGNVVRREAGGSPHDLEDWLDIDLIGRRTEMVTRLIYYPFIIQTLMVLSRNTVFDNWSFPPALVIAISVGLLIAIACAMHLRSEAERARQTALDSLFGKLIAQQEKEASLTEAIRTVIARIEKYRVGAFCPFTQQPWLKALLIPIGSLSAVPILEFLLAMGL